MDSTKNALVPTGPSGQTPAPLVVPLPEEEARAAVSGLQRKAVDLRQFAISENTRRAYSKGWSRFERWCIKHRLDSLPADPGTVHLFSVDATENGIEHQDGTPGKPMNPNSLEVIISAIGCVHDHFGYPDPVKRIPKNDRKAIRNKHGRPPLRKQWISTEQLYESVRQLNEEGSDARTLRNRAILLIAFTSGGRRRSEITGMRREHIERSPDGSWTWTLNRSKTDQEGKGFMVHIPRYHDHDEICPSIALEEWLGASGIESGPVFRAIDKWGNIGISGLQPKNVAAMVKVAVQRLGLDPTKYAGHSLRSGFATSMSRSGVRIEDIMDRTGHKSMSSMQNYLRAGRMGAEDDPVLAALKKRST